MAAPEVSRLRLAQLAPLLAVGATSLIWQVASARSLLEGLRGNELGLGLVLMSWLLLVGLGTVLGARLRSGPASHGLLASVLLLVPAGLVLSAGLQHSPAFADPALVAGPGRTTALALLSLLPACLLLGAGFALAAQAPLSLSAGNWASVVFALESLGTAVAGLGFHFLLTRTSLRSAGLAAGGLSWLVALPLLAELRGRRRVAAWASALIGAIGLVYLIPGLPVPGVGWLSRRVSGYQLLEHQNSPHAALAVLSRGDQIIFCANGQVIFSNQDQQRQELEVHLSLLAHPAPARLLLLGGGLGGGLSESLKHRPQRLDYVELDPLLVELARRHAPELRTALDDARVHLILGDGRQLVSRSAPQSYDVILVGLPGPGSALLNRFYTEEFFAAARRALRPGGLIRVALESGEGYLTPAAALTHRSVLAAMRDAGLHPIAAPGGTTLLLAGRDSEPSLDTQTILRRFKERHLTTHFFGPSEIVDRTLPFQLDVYRQALAGTAHQAAPANRDLHPSAYFQSSLLWLALGSPAAARATLIVSDIAWRWPWLAPALALVLGLVGGRLRRRRPAAGLSLLLAGLTGLSLELEAVLACQLARGVVYRELGILTTAFMLGLTVGAPGGRRLLAAAPRSALNLALAACGATALLSLVLLPLALRWPGAALALLLVDLLAVGASVGACYAPATACLALDHGDSASARAYVWDLVGAALGSLLAGGLALPVLGLTGTSATCAALCIGGSLGLKRTGS